MSERVHEIFQAADRNLKCNTAYPVFKEGFRKFESDADVLSGVSGLSYYIHIPFCRHLCKFCEYTRFQAGDRKQEDRYLGLLEAQIRAFLKTHSVSRVYGLDIGGGTPSALDDGNFEQVLKLAEYLLHGDPSIGIPRPVQADGFENSIEISFSTVSKKKIQLIGEYGIRRVSAGIQSLSRGLLEKQGRAFSTVRDIEAAMRALHEASVAKINLDLMYGMPEQTDDMIDGTLDVIEQLRPEQVTVYEMRYNRMKTIPKEVTRDLLYRQYRIFFGRLTGMGYRGVFGRNTFTRCEDQGVSSYLWYRMNQGIPYKGFGISAQSMGMEGIAYGSLKNTELTAIPDMASIGAASNYLLPGDEMAAKYVSIGMYSGRFRLDVLSRFLGSDARKWFAEELAYLLRHGYIRITGDEASVTEKGFRYYGAVTALFWSKDQQARLLLHDQTR